jgi:hypothetical protein
MAPHVADPARKMLSDTAMALLSYVLVAGTAVAISVVGKLIVQCGADEFAHEVTGKCSDALLLVDHAVLLMCSARRAVTVLQDLYGEGQDPRQSDRAGRESGAWRMRARLGGPVGRRRPARGAHEKCRG